MATEDDVLDSIARILREEYDHEYNSEYALILIERELRKANR